MGPPFSVTVGVFYSFHRPGLTTGGTSEGGAASHYPQGTAGRSHLMPAWGTGWVTALGIINGSALGIINSSSLVSVSITTRTSGHPHHKHFVPLWNVTAGLPYERVPCHSHLRQWRTDGNKDRGVQFHWRDDVDLLILKSTSLVLITLFIK